ncbi:hypothetical protein RIF29_16397 [Crotalaria pallida]|uniref:non-specific serine/threonine protein kinase n=1 Tax=Crotalaria pallida TaxID=3830 RepID=A0AAN9FGF3_CROPI
MNQRTFLSTQNPFTISLLIHSYIIISLQSTITLSSLDPKYEACEPKTCGNGQNISYPFYIKGIQQPFCGYPNYDLTCAYNGFPILPKASSSGQPYIVNEIFYNNRSLRVSIPSFSQPTTKGQCIPRIINFSRYSRRFSIAPRQRKVILFYGCDLSSLPEGIKENRVGCDAENETSSVVALYEEDPNLRLVSKNCNGVMVNTTVENENGGIQESLQRGFMVNWSAGNCVECSNSGGRCGFDYDINVYAFRCYCTDGVYHPRKCDPGSQTQPAADANRLSKAKRLSKERNLFLALLIGLLITIISIIVFFRRRLRCHKLNGLRKDKSKAQKDFEVFLKKHGPLAIRRYSYLEIKKMTNSFAEKLGQGGYGGVFKGKLHDERLVAVKMLNRSKDFGLAKICPQDESMVSMLVARGTPGYIAPEVFSRNFGVVSHKSDVYSFGMMVLEMVGGRKNDNVEVDCSSEIYFPHWIYKRLELNEKFELRNINNESDRKRVRKMVMTSLWCIQTDPSDRPTMHAVVDMLEGRVEALQIPPKPFLSST